MKKLLAMLLAAMMVFTVVGCEQKAETPAATEAPVAGIAGTYKLSGAEMNGEALPMEGAPEMSVTLNADGSATVANGEENIPATWTQEGNTVTLVSPEEAEPMVLTVEGADLVIEDAGMKMIFSK